MYVCMCKYICEREIKTRDLAEKTPLPCAICAGVYFIYYSFWLRVLRHTFITDLAVPWPAPETGPGLPACRKGAGLINLHARRQGPFPGMSGNKAKREKRKKKREKQCFLQRLRESRF